MPLQIFLAPSDPRTTLRGRCGWRIGSCPSNLVYAKFPDLLLMREGPLLLGNVCVWKPMGYPYASLMRSGRELRTPYAAFQFDQRWFFPSD